MTGQTTEACAISSIAPLDRLLPLREVVALTSLSRSSVYRMVKSGSLPPPLKAGKSRIAWRASSIARWLAERQAAA